jgi:hypothetical protein
MVGVTRASFSSLGRDHLTVLLVSSVNKPVLHDTRVSSSMSDNECKDHMPHTSQSDNRRLVAATFSSYRPETDAEVVCVEVIWQDK